MSHTFRCQITTQCRSLKTNTEVDEFADERPSLQFELSVESLDTCHAVIWARNIDRVFSLAKKSAHAFVKWLCDLYYDLKFLHSGGDCKHSKKIYRY